MANAHIQNHSVQAEDGDRPRQIRNPLMTVAKTSAEQRSIDLQRYRERHHSHLDSQFRRDPFVAPQNSPGDL